MGPSSYAALFSRSSGLVMALAIVQTGCGPKKVQGVPIADLERADAIASAAGPPPEPKDEGSHLVRFRQYDGPADPVPLLPTISSDIAPSLYFAATLHCIPEYERYRARTSPPRSSSLRSKRKSNRPHRAIVRVTARAFRRAEARREGTRVGR